MNNPECSCITFKFKIENNSPNGKKTSQEEELTGDMLQIGQNEWDQTHTHTMSLI